MIIVVGVVVGICKAKIVEGGTFAIANGAINSLPSAMTSTIVEA